MEYGLRLLCGRCYHLQINGPEPEHALGSTAFTVIASLCLAALALAGISLCVLYLVGTGDLTWFVVLTILMLVSLGCPAAVLVKRRNLALLIASLYLPLGLWAYLWRLAPGIDWEYGNMTAYGGLFFLAVGLIATILFVRDLRALPRL
jgi:ABC-type transport system involved in multi-copper enzyme maturation permease subunit